jgi:adenosylcobinamide kinase/adenosylcobinamide-phosphate guanylyltransferase
MEAGLPPEEETRKLVQTIAGLSAAVILVSNETGLGIVPDNALARAFRDAQGRLNQTMAAACDHVELIVAGLPLTIK